MVRSLKEKRWHKATVIAWYLQIVPFIRFIGVTGSMAHDIIKPSSDIDIFIIAKEKRIWTCYYFSEFFLRLVCQLRVGNRPEQRAGKTCPNRYVSDKYLIINPQNQYHAQDYTQMVPLFDEEKIYKQFVKANHWMEEYGYFAPYKVMNLVHSNTLNLLRQLSEKILGGKFGDRVENYFRRFQLAKLAKKYPILNKPNSNIIATNDEIRIHAHPR